MQRWGSAEVWCFGWFAARISIRPPFMSSSWFIWSKNEWPYSVCAGIFPFIIFLHLIINLLNYAFVLYSWFVKAITKDYSLDSRSNKKASQKRKNIHFFNSNNKIPHDILNNKASLNEGKEKVYTDAYNV